MYTGQRSADKSDLVDTYAPLVKRIAWHLMGRLPPSVQVDDLIQAGMLGLLGAADQYNSGRGASFETYASIRIRGAMLDELRRTDWAPKSIHRKTRELAVAIQSIESRTGCAPTDREIAAELKIDLEQYYQLSRDTANARLLSFEEETSSGNGGYDRFGSSTPAPLEQLESEEFRQRLMAAIGELAERDQLIMSLYYEQNLNLKEIGAVLEVSESRISQLLSRIHAQLRAALLDE